MILDGGNGKIDGDGTYDKTSNEPNGNTGTVYTIVGSSERSGGDDN